MSRKRHLTVEQVMVYGRYVDAPSDPCVWPGCNGFKMRGLPICVDHAVQVWGVIQDDDEQRSRAQQSRTIQQRYRQYQEATKEAAEQRRRDQIRESRKNQPGWIYFLRWQDQIKIGYTTNIERRLSEYAPGAELVALHPGTPQTERGYHQRFGKHRIGGREWYRPAQDILDHCERVIAEYGPPPNGLKVGRRKAS